MMDEKMGKFVIFVGDDVKCVSVRGANREFYRISDNLVINGDGGWRVDKFNGDKKLAMCYCVIHGVV